MSSAQGDELWIKDDWDCWQVSVVPVNYTCSRIDASAKGIGGSCCITEVGAVVTGYTVSSFDYEVTGEVGYSY